MSAASADASFDAVSNQSTIPSGSGTMQIRNATGKAADAIHFLPRKTNPPATRRHTNDRAIKASESFLLRCQFIAPEPNPMAKAAKPATNGTLAHAGEEPYS